MKIKLLGLFVSLLLFTACSSDDDAREITIIGKWQVEQSFNNNQENDLSVCLKKNIVEFKEYGSGSIDNYSDDSGNCEYNRDSFTYIVNNNTLTIETGDDSVENTFYLTETTLTITNEDDEGTSKSIWNKIN